MKYKILGDKKHILLEDSSLTTFTLNKTDYFDKFALKVRYSTDSKVSWTSSGESSNKIYVTYKTPTLDNVQVNTLQNMPNINPSNGKSQIQESLLRISCLSAKGKTSPTEIFESIFNEFTDLSVSRTGEISSMGYWTGICNSGNNPDCFHSNGLLKLGVGRCGSWAYFLKNLAYTQGLSKIMNYIFEIPSDPLLLNKWKPQHILVKNYQLRDPLDPIDLIGIPAQGNADPISQFVNHVVVKFGNKYYDPSYGKKFNTMQEFLSQAVSGLKCYDQVTDSYKVFASPNTNIISYEAD